MGTEGRIEKGPGDFTPDHRRLTDEVRTAIRDYLKLDEARRRNLHSGGEEAFLFQPLVNYRTLEFAKPSRRAWSRT